jgi:phosphatidylglycerol:prolipoprotein diacylglycerol transferase
VTFVLPFPQIDPVLIEIGPLAIRWYALAYIGAILIGWRYAIHLAKRPPHFIDTKLLDDFVLYATLGVVLGGRLGYVLFYKPDYFLAHPLEILHVWEGGMSFHGGMLGVALAIWLFATLRKIPLLRLADLIAGIAPIGLGLGRLANFINGELWGRVSDVPWAMVFPTGGPLPRHPSQLYQALLEGVLLFLVLFWCERTGQRQKPGLMTGVFLLGYGVARTIGELFRQPDPFLGFLIGGATMGQLLSAPMILIGLYLILRAQTRGRAVA